MKVTLSFSHKDFKDIKLDFGATKNSFKINNILF